MFLFWVSIWHAFSVGLYFLRLLTFLDKFSSPVYSEYTSHTTSQRQSTLPASSTYNSDPVMPKSCQFTSSLFFPLYSPFLCAMSVCFNLGHCFKHLTLSVIILLLWISNILPSTKSFPFISYHNQVLFLDDVNFYNFMLTLAYPSFLLFFLLELGI